MRLLILSILLIFAQQTCHPQQVDVTLIKTTSQRWMGGAVGSGWGNIHRISFLMKNQKGLSIDSLWVNGKRVKADVNKDPGNKPAINSDTINVIAYENYSNLNNKYTGPLNAEMPKGYKGMGVLSYYIGNKKYYLEIENFEKLPDLEYP